MNNLKLLVVILILGIAACDKIPDGVVENNSVDYLVTNISAPDNFAHTLSDSNVVTSIKIDNPQSVAAVWCSLQLLKNQEVIYEKIDLKDDGEYAIDGDEQKDDNIYTGKITMKRSLSSGDYVIEYYIQDNLNLGDNNVAKAAVHQFTYNNGKNNSHPVISDLAMPDSINRNIDFVITLKVSDADGLKDIAAVEFNLYQPSGAYIGKFSLFDDGDTSANGDITANDGIYSSKRSFKTDVTPGVWKFEFIAKDFPGTSSNTITHNLTVN